MRRPALTILMDIYTMHRPDPNCNYSEHCMDFPTTIWRDNAKGILSLTVAVVRLRLAGEHRTQRLSLSRCALYCSALSASSEAANLVSRTVSARPLFLPLTGLRSKCGLCRGRNLTCQSILF